MSEVTPENTPYILLVRDGDPNAHVIPNGDLIEHLPSDDCTCGPRCKPVNTKAGELKWLYLHPSLDGRP